jgi:diguanylate cyclase (GGDEF)-like protein
LTRLGSTCLSKLRRTDLLARIGGEEFAFLVPGNTAPEAMVLAERVREAVGKIELPVGDAALRFTVSIGLAEAGPQDRSINEPLERADQALYEAKRAGRDRIAVAAGPTDPSVALSH